ncbi:MAG: hypothetical protein AB1505_11615 [Candidatus Latescibacterota bacterium]
MFLLASCGAGLVVWPGTGLFEDRHWHAYCRAGDRALEHGGLDWAEKMYRKALQLAYQQEDEEKVRQSYLRLHRLYLAQGQHQLAAQMLALSRASWPRP